MFDQKTYARCASIRTAALAPDSRWSATGQALSAVVLSDTYRSRAVSIANAGVGTGARVVHHHGDS